MEDRERPASMPHAVLPTNKMKSLKILKLNATRSELLGTYSSSVLTVVLEGDFDFAGVVAGRLPLAAGDGATSAKVVFAVAPGDGDGSGERPEDTTGIFVTPVWATDAVVGLATIVLVAGLASFAESGRVDVDCTFAADDVGAAAVAVSERAGGDCTFAARGSAAV